MCIYDEQRAPPMDYDAKPSSAPLLQFCQRRNKNEIQPEEPVADGGSKKNRRGRLLVGIIIAILVVIVIALSVTLGVVVTNSEKRNEEEEPPRDGSISIGSSTGSVAGGDGGGECEPLPVDNVDTKWDFKVFNDDGSMRYGTRVPWSFRPDGTAHSLPYWTATWRRASCSSFILVTQTGLESGGLVEYEIVFVTSTRFVAVMHDSIFRFGMKVETNNNSDDGL